MTACRALALRSVAQSPFLLASRSSAATSNVRPSWIPWRGVATDMRSLQSFDGDAISNTFHLQMQNFLQACFQEGSQQF